MEVCTQRFDVGRNFGKTTELKTNYPSVARHTGKATEQGIHFLTMGLVGRQGGTDACDCEVNRRACG